MYNYRVHNKLISCFLKLSLGDKIPDFIELHQNIVPIYAARWKDLGIQLRIPIHQLDTIAVNYVNHPSYSQQCCKAVLQKWIEITPNPTMNILQTAIDGLTNLSQNDNSQSKK